MRVFDGFLDAFRQNYPSADKLGVPVARWRQSIYRTVFETNTAMGKRFEQYLTLAIMGSLAILIALSTPAVAQSWALWPLRGLEWLLTLAFTAEYVLRLISVRRPWRYVFSFYGIVDLLAVAPTYLAIFFPEAHFMAAIRALRLVRTFHIFPVFRQFLDEYLMLGQALRASGRKIFVFLSVVALIVFVMGALIYVLEGPQNGFTSVPMGIYWAISTVTTVGYGDLTPSTAVGRIFASIMMLLGWGVLAVPTGIVGAELSRASGTKARLKGVECEACGLERHEDDSRYCRRCGTRLQRPGSKRAAAEDSAAPSADKPSPPMAPAEAAPSTPAAQGPAAQAPAAADTAT